MACLEHECNKCGETWFDNDSNSVCPKCGSADNRIFFDEEGDHDPDI